MGVVRSGTQVPFFHIQGTVAEYSSAGLSALPLAKAFRGKNANVFAAVPSLHAAYMFVTTIYAVMSRKRWYTVVLFACICLGIWWTAVYSGHHYIIDVMLGILTTIVGVLLMESKRLWAR